VDAEEQKPTVVAVMGPTACGKSDLALSLRDHASFEIISVDSALVYRGMDIGTAKPEKHILASIPHKLIDICDPAEPYSAAEFCTDARQSIASIITQKRVPLLVGGTMLYFRSLFKGLSVLPPASPEVRAQLDAEARKIGWDGMYRKLAEVDQQAAIRIHPNDPQRIQRALEVFTLTGKAISEFYNDKAPSLFPYHIEKIIVAPKERQQLHARIAKRYLQMLENGLVSEVKALKQRGDLSLSLPSMRAVGYRQVWQYLEGECSYDEMVEKGVVATRQLAKRQMTWLRREENAAWFNSEAPDLLSQVLKFLANTPISRALK